MLELWHGVPKVAYKVLRTIEPSKDEKGPRWGASEVSFGGATAGVSVNVYGIKSREGVSNEKECQAGSEAEWSAGKIAARS